MEVKDLKVEKHQCGHCGYVYVYIEYDNGNKMNLPFENLYNNWTCPTCGLSKHVFEKMDSE
jgi:rubredoxin